MSDTVIQLAPQLIDLDLQDLTTLLQDLEDNQLGFGISSVQILLIHDPVHDFSRGL